MSRSMSDTLRAVAEFIEQHPDLPVPLVTIYDHRPEEAELDWFLTINGRADDEADQKAKATAIVRGIGGKWDKEPFGDTMSFRRKHDGLNLSVQVERAAVCERIVTGTETVTIAAVEAQAERTEERELVEWRCEPLLAEVSA